MADCSSIAPSLTPFVDGELADAERMVVTEHLGVCGPCRSRVEAERAVRSVVRSNRLALQKEHASQSLRARCSAMADIRATIPADITTPTLRSVRSVESHRQSDDRVAVPASRVAPSRWRARFVPLAAAATLLLIVAGAFLYRMTESSAQLMAAELTADHVKCFAVNGVLGTHESAGAVQGWLASSFGWSGPLFDSERAGLELVGSRPCLYGNGRVAHIMYRRNGQPVSLFMLPNTTRREQILDVFGHEAAIWCIGNRTFVLIARETRAEMERMAAVIHASLE